MLFKSMAKNDETIVINFNNQRVESAGSVKTLGVHIDSLVKKCLKFMPNRMQRDVEVCMERTLC